MTCLDADHIEEIKRRTFNSMANILIQIMMLSTRMSMKLATTNRTEIAILMDLCCTLFTGNFSIFIANKASGSSYSKDNACKCSVALYAGNITRHSGWVWYGWRNVDIESEGGGYAERAWGECWYVLKLPLMYSSVRSVTLNLRSGMILLWVLNCRPNRGT